VEAPAELFPLPARGRRADAVARLTSVSWPLTHLELPGYQLNYALTDSPLQRLKILLVLRASGHRIGTRARGAAASARRAATRSQPVPEVAARRPRPVS
jgi:hypothetical protein